jgi:hypothetical protein
MNMMAEKEKMRKMKIIPHTGHDGMKTLMI